MRPSSTTSSHTPTADRVHTAARIMGETDARHEAAVENFFHDAEHGDLPIMKSGSAHSAVKGARNQIAKPKRTKKQLLDLFSVAEVLSDYGMNPAEEIVKALKGDLLDLDTKVKLHATLLEYVAPKLKSMELNGTLKVERTPEEIEARLQELATLAKDVTNT